LLHKIDPTALRSSFADVSGIGHQISGIRTLRPDPDRCLPIPDGEGAPPHGFTAAFGARIDLLFTMSDITRAPAKADSARIGSVANEMSAPSGGARRDRTDDLLLAKQALSQLSYGPAPVSVCCQSWLAKP
jgi:hypothetical protein